MKNPKNVLITGATSGIGEALAIKYARKSATLYLTGRDEERMEKIQQICEDLGAEVHIKYIDITNEQDVIDWINKIEVLDLVIANAGISAGTGGGGESHDQVKKIFNTNIYGVLNTIHPAIEKMKKREEGQIAIVSSLAGYRGFPSSPAYCASKAAVKVYGEALRVSLKKDGIGLTVITPGYIKTPMTDVNDFYMPFLIGVEKSVDIIVSKLEKNPARIAFPRPLYFVVWLISILPPCVVDPILSILPKKNSV